MKILELTFNELAKLLHKKYGKGKYHAAAVYREVFRNSNLDFENVDEFSGSFNLARQLKDDIELNLFPVIDQKKELGVTKFITGLKDGVEIESVLVPMANYQTICISSQVGCKMGCSFCETAKLGFLRNLTVEEIVGQVFTAKVIFRHNIRNIVFMGMGEPLDNFKNVIQAIRVMSDQRGLNFSKSRITVSTAGMVDGIYKIGRLNWPRLNLAVSLNASNDRIRSEIMPINRAASMSKLRKALIDYPLRKSGTFFIEYVLIKDINDSAKHADEIAEFLKPLKTRLNLIPYNPISYSRFKPPSEEDMDRFSSRLAENKLFVRRRSIKGQNLKAACGQLGNRNYL